MLKHRVIPSLLLRNGGLVKTLKFADPKYVGDPINAIRIFNEKEVDELILLDITASVRGTRPDVRLISEIAGECFMPLCYGGGIQSIDDIGEIFASGVEKVCLNTRAAEDPPLIRRAADKFGSQSIVVSIDVVRTRQGHLRVVARSGTAVVSDDPEDYAKKMEDMGAGELFLNSVNRDGTEQGFDLPVIRQVAAAVTIPVIACGGAGSLADFAAAVEAGASAVAAGSLFVFHGKHRAVLIHYPRRQELEAVLR